jgi:CHAT domain-containing protein/tetratricopeptide (TPR) repeat protein
MQAPMSFARSAPFCLIAILASASAHGIAPAVQEARAMFPPIAPGKILESAVSGGEVRRHSLTLAADQSATIVVVHRNIDVIVRLLEAEGEPDIEMTSDGATGEVRLRIHATRSGPHALEIAAAYPKSSAGSYTVRVDDVGAGTATDRQLSEARRHHSRARRLRSTGAYAAALSHAEQALTLREKALGPDSLEVARSLLLLGQIKDDQARFGIAENLYLRARGIAERTSDRHALVYAEILDSLARNQFVRARFAEGERLAKDALEIRERTVGGEHFLVAVSLGTLSDLYVASSDVRQAQITADRAFEIAAKAYGPADITYGDFTNRVARAQVMLGNYARAEALYLESLEVRENSVGPESLAAADSLTGLARVVLLKNDNVKAEQLFLETVAIKEKILGPDHLEVGILLHSLAQLHLRRRDYPTAIALNTRSLALKEKALGGSHPLIKATLNNLGLVYWRQGDYPRAEEFFRRSLEMAEQFSGPDSLELVPPLGNLGIIAKETGNYDLAEARYMRALAITEKNLGPHHPDLIWITESLGILYRDRGNYAAAEPMLQRTISITSASLGPEHPFVARHLDNLVHLHWAAGNWQSAFAALQRMMAIEERNLPLNLSIGSERQKLSYFEPRLRNLEEAISFHVQQPRDHPGARDLAITALLQRKGRVLDALADNLSAFRTRSTPDDQALLDRLSRVASDLAAAVLSDSTKSPAAQRQRDTAALAAERERLEIEIHARSAGYLEPSRPLTLAAVQNAVPSDAALLEFSIYRPFDPRAAFESGKQFGAPRYIAYVVRHSVETRWKDLGPAEQIDRAVDGFRSALADPARPDVIRLATELHRRLIAPLQPLFGDARHLVISPDGALNLVPFEALRSVERRYLVEDLAISYVTAGRDLVRMLLPRPTASRAALFANPVFGEPTAHQNTATRAPLPTSPRTSRRGITAGQDLSAVYFAPLAGTASEAQRIHALFPEMELRLGARATEKALKSLQAPRILHVATHGFFLQDGDSPEVKPSTAGTRVLNATARIDNPLLRSGLAFAGANLPRSGDDDGILTALEAANLNLWGTKLVTLSACDTGIGVVRNGEGVYGLRRAFFLAGAESLVMSLWPVSDQITREMMSGYYAGLKEGLGRGAALRRMQLHMLKRKGRSHPFYWASFIQAGEWANLDGQR